MPQREVWDTFAACRDPQEPTRRAQVQHGIISPTVEELSRHAKAAFGDPLLGSRVNE